MTTPSIIIIIIIIIIISRSHHSPSLVMAHGAHDPTAIKPNEFIERHAAKRETIERTFRVTPKTFALFAVFGVVVPMVIYRACVKEFVRRSMRARARTTSRVKTRARRHSTRDIRHSTRDGRMEEKGARASRVSLARVASRAD